MSTTRYINVTRSLKTLKQDIDPANYTAIVEFIDHLAAEGLSESHQQSMVTSLKRLLVQFAPDGFTLRGATEADLKTMVAALHRSDYAAATQHKSRAALKKFYKVEHGGSHPAKVDFFSASHTGKATTVTREDLFTDDELTRLFQAFTSTRDRAATIMLYESAARPGELLTCNIADFTSTEKGDFIHLQGLKGTPDRTTQLVRAGRVIREWLAQHPLGGDLGAIRDPHAPLWVKTEQQACRHCGQLARDHEAACAYEPALDDRLPYDAFLRRFKAACERVDIPAKKRRPYNLRHTRLTEVATFMGYEQLNKFAGWKPGSDRAKVYVHLNNEDVNKAIRSQYGLATTDEPMKQTCAICGSANQAGQTECRTCARPLSLKHQATHERKLRILERLAALEDQEVLDRLDTLARLEDEQE